MPRTISRSHWRPALGFGAIALAALLAGCGTSRAGASHAATSILPAHGQPSSVQPTNAPTTTAPPAPAGRPYGVGVLTAGYTEPPGHVVPAPFAPGGEPAAPRRLQVEVLYPSTSPPSGIDVPGAPPDTTGGPFPVVVFSPGLNEDPPAYLPLLHDWAQAGYVVAGVTYPVTNPAVPNAGDKEGDLPRQPYDVTFLLDSLLAAAGNASDPLHSVVDPARIAAAGQSDGGNTTLATAYNSAYQDDRIKAAVVLSGARYGFPGGTWFPAGSPPLLAIQGTADTINPPSLTNDFFTNDPQPDKYLLCLLGASHLDPYVSRNNDERVVSEVTIAFLDEELSHRPGSLDAMMRAGAGPGLAAYSSQCPPLHG